MRTFLFLQFHQAQNTPTTTNTTTITSLLAPRHNLITMSTSMLQNSLFRVQCKRLVLSCYGRCGLVRPSQPSIHSLVPRTYHLLPLLLILSLLSPPKPLHGILVPKILSYNLRFPSPTPPTLPTPPPSYQNLITLYPSWFEAFTFLCQKGWRGGSSLVRFLFY